MNNKRRIGILLVVGALIVAGATLGKALYSAPGSDDTGIPLTAGDIQSEDSNTASLSRTKYDLPKALLIPKLDIEAKVQHLGVTASGNMAAPDNFTDVSWYKYGSAPGEKGSAVLSGHEDNAVSLDGVFKHLQDLKIGDEVIVERADGKKLSFEVIEMKVYPYNNSPTDRIFNDKSGKYLNLITCAGDWLPEAKTNDKRLVVYTKLVE